MCIDTLECILVDAFLTTAISGLQLCRSVNIFSFIYIEFGIPIFRHLFCHIAATYIYTYMFIDCNIKITKSYSI